MEIIKKRKLIIKSLPEEINITELLGCKFCIKCNVFNNVQYIKINWKILLKFFWERLKLSIEPIDDYFWL